MAVVLIIGMQYGSQIILMVICNIYYGVLKFRIYANYFLYASIALYLRHDDHNAEMQ